MKIWAIPVINSGTGVRDLILNINRKRLERAEGKVNCNVG